MLVHAEIENYLEDRTWDVALLSVGELEKSKRIGKVVACLIAFSGQTQDFPPDTVFPPKKTNHKDWQRKIDITEKAKAALNAFRYVIDTNNGIREKNILSLLLPIGIIPAQIDATWLSTIDSFGKQRGVVAHLSAVNYRAQQQPDPKTELDTVILILNGLLVLDGLMNELD